jgi:transporter family-2 protein
LIFGLAPAILGVLVVLQAGVNRKLASQWGLTSAVLLNALVLFILAALLFILCLWKPEFFPKNLRSSIDFKNFRLWFLLPGLMGFCLVIGGPFAVARWGAVQTFILVISAQLITSLIWDFQVEGLGISYMRLLGIALAWSGAFLIYKS